VETPWIYDTRKTEKMRTNLEPLWGKQFIRVGGGDGRIRIMFTWVVLVFHVFILRIQLPES